MENGWVRYDKADELKPMKSRTDTWRCFLQLCAGSTYAKGRCLVRNEIFHCKAMAVKPRVA
jgi:hypothetical protein